MNIKTSIKKPHPLGFTLVEVLVALMVFAILATLTSQSLFQAFRTQEQINKELDRLQHLQITMTLISRDIPQIAVRSIYTGTMKYKPAIIAKPKYLEITRDGLINPDAFLQQSSLKRVAYLCREQKLIRRTWPAMDMVDEKGFDDQVLLRHLDKCYFNYIDENNQVLESFMPKSARTIQLPRGIGINLSLEGRGEIHLVFAIPEGAYG